MISFYNTQKWFSLFKGFFYLNVREDICLPRSRNWKISSIQTQLYSIKKMELHPVSLVELLSMSMALQVMLLFLLDYLKNCFKKNEVQEWAGRGKCMQARLFPFLCENTLYNPLHMGFCDILCIFNSLWQSARTVIKPEMIPNVSSRAQS